MTRVLEMTLARSLPALAGLAARAETFLAEAGVGGMAAFKVQLALEESVRNLIEHAVDARSDRVQVRIELGAGQIAIEVEDDGQPFDPGTGPPYDVGAPLAERHPHGMGLHLLRNLMDEIHYDRVGASNHLRLVVSLLP
jgi:anti-sigma regulatory factor (Ser/Thr protein kinase)